MKKENTELEKLYEELGKTLVNEEKIRNAIWALQNASVYRPEMVQYMTELKEIKNDI